MSDSTATIHEIRASSSFNFLAVDTNTEGVACSFHLHYGDHGRGISGDQAINGKSMVFERHPSNAFNPCEPIKIQYPNLILLTDLKSKKCKRLPGESNLARSFAPR